MPRAKARRRAESSATTQPRRAAPPATTARGAAITASKSTAPRAYAWKAASCRARRHAASRRTARAPRSRRGPSDPTSPYASTSSSSVNVWPTRARNSAVTASNGVEQLLLAARSLLCASSAAAARPPSRRVRSRRRDTARDASAVQQPSLGPDGSDLREDPVAELVAAARERERGVRVQALQAARRRRAADPDGRARGRIAPLLSLARRRGSRASSRVLARGASSSARRRPRPPAARSRATRWGHVS